MELARGGAGKQVPAPFCGLVLGFQSKGRGEGGSSVSQQQPARQ
jgi:hypothetical protein